MDKLIVAADQGNAKAQYNLGMDYYTGCGVPKDLKKAVRYLQLAADQGYDIAAQCNLGLCYEIYLLAADQGHAIAQSCLGVCYGNGAGVPKDMKEAVRYFRLAADQGYFQAQYNLGLCYENGNGIPKDLKEAVRYYRLAADRHCALAIEALTNPVFASFVASSLSKPLDEKSGALAIIPCYSNVMCVKNYVNLIIVHLVKRLNTVQRSAKRLLGKQGIKRLATKSN